MSTASRPDLDAVADFLWRNARLLDRHRFAYFTGAGGAEPVVATLRAYRNADGGFGNALERTSARRSASLSRSSWRCGCWTRSRRSTIRS